jgi:hypothetical protein
MPVEPRGFALAMHREFATTAREATRAADQPGSAASPTTVPSASRAAADSSGAPSASGAAHAYDVHGVRVDKKLHGARSDEEHEHSFVEDDRPFAGVGEALHGPCDLGRIRQRQAAPVVERVGSLTRRARAPSFAAALALGKLAQHDVVGDGRSLRSARTRVEERLFSRR